MRNSSLYMWLLSTSRTFGVGLGPERKRQFFSRYASIYNATKPHKHRSFLMENRIKQMLARYGKPTWFPDEFFAVASHATCHTVKPRKRTNTYQVRLRIKERECV